MSIVIRGLVSCALVCSAVAQTVWTATGPSLQPVVDAAAPGDVVLLPDALYENITLTQGLTLIGTNPGGTAIRDPGLIQGSVESDTVVNLPPGQRAQFVGLEFRRSSTPPGQLVGTLRLEAGQVAFSGCAFLGSRIEIEQGAVRFDRCESLIRAHWDLMSDVDVQIVDSTLFGSVSLGDGCTLQISGSNLTGLVDPLSGVGSAVIGMIGTVDSSTWITDSTIQGAGGSLTLPALVGDTFYLARSTVTDDAGALPVPATVIAAPELVGASSSGALQVGGQFDCSWTVDGPGQSLAVLLSVGIGGPLDVAGLLAQLLWGGGVSLVSVAAVVSDANGDAGLSVAIPNDPALRYHVFGLHAVRGGALPLQLAPVLGGVVE